MSYRHTDAALALLEGGANVNIRDRAGNSPLHVAAQQGDLAVVKELLAKGVDPNIRTPRSLAAVGVEAAVAAFGPDPAVSRPL